MLFPLITYPYLIRVLGKETYGLVIYAQAIISYFQILITFGFNISATKDVSIYRHDKEKLSEIVSSVITIKGIFLLLSFLALAGLLWCIPQAKGYELLFLLTMLGGLADVLFIGWYFQGIERMKYITYLTLLSRVVFLGMIFIFIKEPGDYLLMPVITAAGSIVSGFLSLYIAFGLHKLKLKLYPVKVLKKYVTESVPIFVSNVSIKIYVSANKVIIGSLLGMSEVAYYDLGEKLTSLLKIPQGLLSQALFPKINHDKDKSFVKRIFNLSILFNIALVMFIIILAKPIVVFLGGSQMLPAIWVIIILALSVPVIAMSNIFGIQILIPFGLEKKFTKVVLMSGLVYLVQLLFVWAIWGLNIYNLSIITVLTEVFVTSYMFYYCRKFGIW